MLPKPIKVKSLILILAISLLLLFLLASLLKSSQNFKRYVREDMTQSVTRLNQYLSDSSFEIRNIIHEKKMDYNQLKSIEQRHTNISKELYNLHLKGNIAGGRIQEEIENTYSSFIYSEGLNDEKIRLFFKDLGKKTDENKNIKLESKDLVKIESVIKCYSDLRAGLTNISS
jgi:hypothetical protein